LIRMVHTPKRPACGLIFRPRILRGPRGLPAALRTHHPRARPSTNRARGGHRTSYGGLDRKKQLRNAFSEHDAPRYLLHDCDSVFADVATTIAGMNTQAVRTAPRSPWQNAYAERVIGSIRRECLDHVIAINETGLRRVLTRYIAYYMESRTHLALKKDAPVTRPVAPASAGRIVVTPHVGGLHHRYDRVAA